MNNESTRLAYLQALEIDVWQPRSCIAVDDKFDSVDATPNDIATLTWDDIQQRVKNCQACRLHETRTNTVFGIGNANADWMVIGEAPGQEEDRKGEPFVGRAGKLLDEMLRALGLDRESVFIANTLKCRPPNNRDPSQDEAAACRGFLQRQIELVEPKVVLAVGRIAAQNLLQSDAPLGKLRGQRHFLKDGTSPLVVTYHPAYLLRSPSQKSKAWQDLCLAREIVEKASA